MSYFENQLLDFYFILKKDCDFPKEIEFKFESDDGV